MMNPYVLLIAALVVMAAVGAAGFKGYSLGEEHIRVEWQAATLKAKEEADAKAQAERENARRTAATLQTSLSKEKRLTNDLNSALQAHIRTAKPLPVGCPNPELDAGLFDIWNRSNAGPEGDAGGKLSGTGGKPAETGKP